MAEQMRRNKEDAEVTVQLDFAEGVANVCVAEWPAYHKKFVKLWGPPKDISSARVSYWTVPLSLVRFRAIPELRKSKGAFKPGKGLAEKLTASNSPAEGQPA